MRFGKPLAALLPVMLAAGIAYAQGAKVSSAVELAIKADTLKPGEWVWAPQVAPQGHVTVYVDLSRQFATVYRNGVRVGVSTVSSGKRGHETPVGVFTILQKDANHRSSKYNNAPMKFQERLTWDGVALHAGGLPGYPESHGCVHLPLEFAWLLFGVTDMGGTVVVAGRAGGAQLARSAGVLAPIDDAGADALHQPLPAGTGYRWTPDAAPAGPLTVIASRSDQRVVVLRNGVEIGRARAVLPTDDFQTHVMTLTRSTAGKPQWVLVGVPGHGGEDGRPLNTGILSQARLPQPFLTALRTALIPGSTVLVTQSPVLPSTTGKQMIVLASKDWTERPRGGRSRVPTHRQVQSCLDGPRDSRQRADDGGHRLRPGPCPAADRAVHRELRRVQLRDRPARLRRSRVALGGRGHGATPRPDRLGDPSRPSSFAGEPIRLVPPP